MVLTLDSRLEEAHRVFQAAKILAAHKFGKDVAELVNDEAMQRFVQQSNGGAGEITAPGGAGARTANYWEAGRDLELGLRGAEADGSSHVYSSIMGAVFEWYNGKPARHGRDKSLEVPEGYTGNLYTGSRKIQSAWLGQMDATFQSSFGPNHTHDLRLFTYQFLPESAIFGTIHTPDATYEILVTFDETAKDNPVKINIDLYPTNSKLQIDEQIGTYDGHLILPPHYHFINGKGNPQYWVRADDGKTPKHLMLPEIVGTLRAHRDHGYEAAVSNSPINLVLRN